MEAFTPSKLKGDSLSNYGLGWELRTHPLLGKVVWHSGDNPGYKTALVRYIEVLVRDPDPVVADAARWAAHRLTACP